MFLIGADPIVLLFVAETILASTKVGLEGFDEMFVMVL